MPKKSKLANEFKTFIMRGNVIDMAVGVIIGGAFTAIVNSLSNNILKPIINWALALLLGKDSLSGVYTFLQRVDKIDANGDLVPNLEESIYIDWGAFINAIINFFVIAIVLFTIVKLINKLRMFNEEILNDSLKTHLVMARFSELKENGVDLVNKGVVTRYFAEKKKAEDESAQKEEAKKDTEDKQVIETSTEAVVETKEDATTVVTPTDSTTEELLREIRDLLKKEVKNE